MLVKTCFSAQTYKTSFHAFLIIFLNKILPQILPEKIITKNLRCNTFLSKLLLGASNIQTLDVLRDFNNSSYCKNSKFKT